MISAATVPYDRPSTPQMTERDLKWFQAEVGRLAAIIEAPASYLPTYGRTEDFARPHIEFDGTQFHFVVVERGNELKRHSSTDPDEILFDVFQTVTSQMASGHSARHRRPNEDFRRLMFGMQLHYLEKLSAAWRAKQKARLDEILTRHPFED